MFNLAFILLTAIAAIPALLYLIGLTLYHSSAVYDDYFCPQHKRRRDEVLPLRTSNRTRKTRQLAQR